MASRTPNQNQEAGMQSAYGAGTAGPWRSRQPISRNRVLSRREPPDRLRKDPTRCFITAYHMGTWEDNFALESLF